MCHHYSERLGLGSSSGLAHNHSGASVSRGGGEITVNFWSTHLLNKGGGGRRELGCREEEWNDI